MIGWGIIGVGDVTEVKANPVIFDAPGSRLVHVMRRDTDLARDYAERHGVPRWSSDAHDLLEDPDVTTVYVATPTSSHLEYTEAALAAGKDVLVEKPIAMDAGQAARMLQAAQDAGRRLWVAYYRRALPRFNAIRDAVASGEIGRVLGVQVSWQKSQLLEGWRWDPGLNRGGEFAETGCHTFDILDLMLGPASDARGQHSDDLHQVAASWTQGEVPASGTWVFGADLDAEYVDVIGERGTLRFSTFTPNAPATITDGSGVRSIEVTDPPHVHGPLVASIIDELQGRGQCLSTGESALRTARTMDAILG